MTKDVTEGDVLRKKGEERRRKKEKRRKREKEKEKKRENLSNRLSKRLIK